MEVPAERVSMRKTHEVLRLHFDLKLKQRQIARSANLSQSTVHEYLRRFTAAGLSWPLPEQMSEAELEAALFSADAKPPRAPARYLPDFSHIHKELQEHKHVTLQLLWEEYTATHPDAQDFVCFSHGHSFCRHFYLLSEAKYPLFVSSVATDFSTAIPGFRSPFRPNPSTDRLRTGNVIAFIPEH